MLDRDSLEPLVYIQPERGAVICVAANVGGVRLIDNIVLEPH